jgi:hypothetical protein
MATTRAEVRDAATMVRGIRQRVRRAGPATAAILTQAKQQLERMQLVVTRILAQTRAVAR